MADTIEDLRRRLVLQREETNFCRQKMLDLQLAHERAEAARQETEKMIATLEAMAPKRKS